MIFKLARFSVRADARDAAERTMHEVASQIRQDRDASWVAYRDPDAPTHYLALGRNTDAFPPQLRPFLDGDVEHVEYELVTSTDLARRPPARRRRRS